MKILLLSICLFAFIQTKQAVAQNINDPFVEIISSNDIAKLKPYFSSRLQININDNSRIVSAQQAYTILYEFFQSNVLRSFKATLKGGNTQNRYLSGMLDTHNGKYNISIHYTQPEQNKQRIIHQIRIKKYEGKLRLSESTY